jgi:uncharacterized protein (DUF2141 family)
VALPAASPIAHLDVSVDGLRSARGTIRICVTTRPDRFPGCAEDPAARKANVPIAEAGDILFADLPSGDYAVALIHDENGNARLDTFAGVPREGVGFSRNPRLMFGPPRFSAASFTVTNGPVREAVRVKYFL